MAASERARWRRDQMVIKQTVEDLFGPGAYAADKSESSEDNCDRRTGILGEVHALHGGHGGVAVYMYRLEYVYTLILE